MTIFFKQKWKQAGPSEGCLVTKESTENILDQTAAVEQEKTDIFRRQDWQELEIDWLQ